MASGPSSSDRIAIENAARRFRANDTIRANIIPAEWGAFSSDFETVAQFVTGNERYRLKALRVLRRHFSRRQMFMLSLLAEGEAYQDWRLVIRRRKPGEKPDRGQRDRTREREWRATCLGKRVYSEMKLGASKAEAIATAKRELRLRVSEATIERDLALFRERARENGFVDPFAAVIAAVVGGPVAEPDLTVAEITKKGRPKKR